MSVHTWPNIKTPRYVDFVTEFPMNAAGKILKYKMRERAVEKLGLQAESRIATAWDVIVESARFLSYSLIVGKLTKIKLDKVVRYKI